jgi:hypothetical protein
MRALKLVQHMKANAGRMSEAVLQKVGTDGESSVEGPTPAN